MSPSIVTIDSSESLEKILEVVVRDGGVIVANFLAPELLKETMATCEQFTQVMKLKADRR